MRVIVLGSGVIGVTSAYYLACAGHEVTVIDRHPAPALETSFANAGQISPGYAAPWAAPGILFKTLKWLFQEHAPLRIVPDGSLFQLRWLFQMLRNCTSARYAINKSRMVRIAEYSQDCLKALRAKTHIKYEGRQGGTLQVFRTPQQLRAAERDIAILQKLGVLCEFFSSPESLVSIEPALARTYNHFVGGLRLPGDETGDCQLFTTELANMAEALGVRFRYNLPINKLLVSGQTIDGVVCGDEILHADCYVVALGTDSTSLLQGIISLPVYPIKGYSITLPIINEAASPLSTVLDETYKVAITRFDSRIRVGGIAEVVGYDKTLNPKRRATLAMVIDDLFPHAGDMAQASFWTGLRAMTPDGTPFIGTTPLKNLFINTGHGTLGWTMACGSAELLADIISKRQPALDVSDYSFSRYG